MSRWTWRTEETTRGVAFALTCDDAPAGRIEPPKGVDVPPETLRALCDSLSSTDTPQPCQTATDSRKLTDKQRTAIHIGMAELGYRERAQRLAAISAFLGREIRSTNDLTFSEASAVLDRIEERKRRREKVA